MFRVTLTATITLTITNTVATGTITIAYIATTGWLFAQGWLEYVFVSRSIVVVNFMSASRTTSMYKT